MFFQKQIQWNLSQVHSINITHGNGNSSHQQSDRNQYKLTDWWLLRIHHGFVVCSHTKNKASENTIVQMVQHTVFHLSPVRIKPTQFPQTHSKFILAHYFVFSSDYWRHISRNCQFTKSPELFQTWPESNVLTANYRKKPKICISKNTPCHNQTHINTPPTPQHNIPIP